MKNQVSKEFEGMVVFLAVVLAIAASLNGCAPLKKKFIRKKNADKENKFIPVLEPVDYEKEIYSTKQYYGQAYSLWMVWQKDLIQSFNDKSSLKNQKYLINQAITELRKMSKFLNEISKDKLNGIISEYESVNLELQDAFSIGNLGSIKRQIERNGKKVRLNYSPRLLEENAFVEEN